MYEQRTARVEALKATLATPVPVQFDRAAFFEGMKTIGGQWYVSPLVNERSPAPFRQVLRKLGIERVVVTAAADGKSWTFEGAADVGGLINTRTPAPVVSKWQYRYSIGR